MATTRKVNAVHSTFVSHSLLPLKIYVLLQVSTFYCSSQFPSTALFLLFLCWLDDGTTVKRFNGT